MSWLEWLFIGIVILSCALLYTGALFLSNRNYRGGAVVLLLVLVLIVTIASVPDLSEVIKTLPWKEAKY